MTLCRAGLIGANTSAYFLPPSLTVAQKGGDSPEGECVCGGWVWALLPLPIWPSIDGAPMKYQAQGRGWQALESWIARLGQEGLLRPGPTPHLPGSRVVGKG